MSPMFVLIDARIGYSTVLFCIELYCFVLYCTVQYCTVRYLCKGQLHQNRVQSLTALYSTVPTPKITAVLNPL